jgi:hypothetical protein
MRQDVANNVSINLPIFDCQKHCTSHEKGAIPYAKNAVILCVNLFIPWAELLIVEKLWLMGTLGVFYLLALLHICK